MRLKPSNGLVPSLDIGVLEMLANPDLFVISVIGHDGLDPPVHIVDTLIDQLGPFLAVDLLDPLFHHGVRLEGPPAFLAVVALLVRSNALHDACVH